MLKTILDFDFNIIFSSNECILIKLQGNRENMQDYHFISNYKTIKIFGVFDGHLGKDLSKYLSLYNFSVIHENVYKYIILGTLSYKHLQKKINKIFIDIDKNLLNNHLKSQGSTLHIVYIYDNNVLIINLGDSKTSIYDLEYNQVFSSIQHRPSIETERKRIELQCSIINNNGIFRINNELSLSRCFGDIKYKLINNKYDGVESPVSIIPLIQTFLINDFSYMIIATDGFWDYICDDEIKFILRTFSHLTLEKITKILISQSIKNNSNDNIIIFLIKLNFPKSYF